MARRVSDFLCTVTSSNHAWKITVLEKWDLIIGNLRDKVVLERVTNDALILIVDNPSWAQELHFLAPTLKRKVNALLKQECIQHVRFKTVTRLPARYVQSSKHQQEKPQDSCERSAMFTIVEQERLAKVVQPSLRHELALYARRCKQLQKR